MYAAGFEGLLYTILSEEPFKNQKFRMKEQKDDYTISDYVSRHFGMIVGETITCIDCHQNNTPKVLKDDSFIMSLGEISI